MSVGSSETESMFNIRKGLGSNASTKKKEQGTTEEKGGKKKKTIIEKPDAVASVHNSSSKEAEAGG